jgi:hypothetical protein
MGYTKPIPRNAPLKFESRLLPRSEMPRRRTGRSRWVDLLAETIQMLQQAVGAGKGDMVRVVEFPNEEQAAKATSRIAVLRRADPKRYPVIWRRDGAEVWIALQKGEESQ